MKLAIIGCRYFNGEVYSDYDFVKLKIDEVITSYKHFGLKVEMIVSGGAIGADTLGERYADENNISKMILKPDWDKNGKRAGFLRNSDIVENCDVLLAFWDYKTKGTQDTIKKIQKTAKPYYIFNIEKPVPNNDLISIGKNV